jgi:hypothetical protein
MTNTQRSRCSGIRLTPTNGDETKWQASRPTPLSRYCADHSQLSDSNTTDVIRATVFVLSYPMTGRLHSFLTSALLRSQRSRPCPGPLTPVSTEQKARWPQRLVWKGMEKKESLARTGIQTPDRPARSESLHRLSNPNPSPHEGRH